MNKIMRTVLLLILCAVTVSLAVSCGSKDSPNVPAGMKLASTEDVDYYFYVPKDWTVDISTGVISAYYTQADRSNISFEAFNLEDPYMPVPDFWAGYADDFTQTFSDMEYETEGETTLLGGIAAYKYVYTATVVGQQYKFMQTVAVKEGVVYIFTYTALPERYDGHTEEIAAVLEQVVFK